jgi:hypothetical protein
MESKGKPILETRCPKCGGEFKEGVALVNTVSHGIEDFPGSHDLRGQTFSYTGQAEQVKVLKCVECGHSRG